MNKEKARAYFAGRDFIGFRDTIPGRYVAYRAWRYLESSQSVDLDGLDVFEICGYSDLFDADFVQCLKEAGVDEFIVTDDSTALMTTLNCLCRSGCRITGMADVTHTCGERETVPGVRLEII